MSSPESMTRPDPEASRTGERFVGPLEVAEFPTEIRARVITPGERARVHGYDLEGDLAHHYDFTSLLLLCLSGELPTPLAARAAQVALMFASGVSVAHASVHAAVLTRLCGSSASSVFGVAAVGLAEQSRFELDQCGDLLDWLGHQSRPYPEAHRSQTESQRGEVERLRAALPEGYSTAIMEQSPTRQALMIAVLRDAGLRRREQLEAALVTARLPSAIAEALAERPTNFAKYPIDLPRIEYHDPNAPR